MPLHENNMHITTKDLDDLRLCPHNQIFLIWEEKPKDLGTFLSKRKFTLYQGIQVSSSITDLIFRRSLAGTPLVLSTGFSALGSGLGFRVSGFRV